MLSMLVGSSVLIAGLCLLHFFFRGRVRASVIYGLWLLVPLRLFLFPVFTFFFGDVTWNSGFSAICWANRAAQWLVEKMPDSVREAWQETGAARIDLASFRVPWWFFVLWFAGFLGVLLWSAVVNERFRRRLYNTRVTLGREQTGEGGKSYCTIYKAPHLVSPCVFKVRSERGIYLTETIAEDERMQEYVLAHELTHLRRRDIFWGQVRVLLLACFWFHPLVWVMAVLSKRDCELSCDEKAIKRLGESKRRYYGYVLLRMVNISRPASDVVSTATTMVSGKRGLRQRIINIAGGEKNLFLSLAVAMAVLALALPTSFVSRADIRGLSPEETVRQAVYYENQHDQEGVDSLTLEDDIQESLPSADTEIIYESQIVTGEQPMEDDIQDPDPLPFVNPDINYENQSVIRVKSCREVTGDTRYDWGGEQGEYYDRAVCLLEYVQEYEEDYPEEETWETEMPEGLGEEVQREVWSLVKENRDSDWKIIRKGMVGQPASEG